MARTPIEEIAYRLRELEEEDGDSQAIRIVILIIAHLFALLNNLTRRQRQHRQ